MSFSVPNGCSNCAADAHAFRRAVQPESGWQRQEIFRRSTGCWRACAARYQGMDDKAAVFADVCAALSGNQPDEAGAILRKRYPFVPLINVGVALTGVLCPLSRLV